MHIPYLADVIYLAAAALLLDVSFLADVSADVSYVADVLFQSSDSGTQEPQAQNRALNAYRALPQLFTPGHHKMPAHRKADR